jgi:hypothetical protein
MDQHQKWDLLYLGADNTQEHVTIEATRSVVDGTWFMLLGEEGTVFALPSNRLIYAKVLETADLST